MQYALSSSVPLIVNVSQLSAVLECTPAQISRCANASEAFYRRFEIPKSSGALRAIDAPLPSLLYIQRGIYEHILMCVRCSENAHGFIKGRSIFTHASTHKEGNEFFLADIKDFFPSIGLPTVIRIFQNLGYDHKMATMLGLICTLRQSLPQGAPSSPALSNIACLQLDERLQQLASKFSLKYSRYADDMAFSGSHINMAFCDMVRQVVKSEGFELNENKSLLARNRGKIIITGISISRNRLCLPRSTKRALRQQSHRLIRNGIIQESNSSGVFDPFYVDRILGKLNFWSHVEPKNPFPLRMIADIRVALKRTIQVL